MNWLTDLLSTPSPIQTLIVVSIICSSGLALGKLRLGGISLGVAFVFFVGILAGSIGLRGQAEMLSFAQTFGLAIFIYALGLHVGPNFFSQFRHEGLEQNLWAMGVVLIGTTMAVGLTPCTQVSLVDMVGILCGATTNTPALGAAQQTLEQMGRPSGSMALATAVTYPLGVLGVIVGMIVVRALMSRFISLQPHHPTDENRTFIGQYEIENPQIDGLSLREVGRRAGQKFIVSRLWRGQKVIMPVANTVLRRGDRLVVVTTPEAETQLEAFFGRRIETDWNAENVDWNHIDTKLESRTLVVSRKVLNGKRLGHLHLREVYGVTVSRVFRGGLKLLATDNLRLQYGDRVSVVGTQKAIDHVESFFGNAVQTLNEPEVGSIFLGLVLGLLLGSIPLFLPGMDFPVRLGLAGGCIVMGIVVGALGPRMHFISYTTSSASLMLRRMGLALYLACLGLSAGAEFVPTLLRPEGLLWIGLGAVITILPVVLTAALMVRLRRMDFGSVCGIMCGAMANPMALAYADDTTNGETPSLSYAAVYPLSMFVRIIIAQFLILFFC